MGIIWKCAKFDNIPAPKKVNKGMQTEQTKESVDCLELENCTLKNVRTIQVWLIDTVNVESLDLHNNSIFFSQNKDQLESKIEVMKSNHVNELKKLNGQIDDMTRRNDELNKKLQLTNEVIKSNNNFKREINELKEKVKSFDDRLIDQDKLKSEIDGLREQ